MVGDNAARIALAIGKRWIAQISLSPPEGLGPTVDDPTRQAVAMAVGVETEFRPELWDQIQNRFKRFNRIATENNKRQALYSPRRQPVENPVGTAPAFIVRKGIPR